MLLIESFFINASLSLSVHQDDVGTEAGEECRDEPHVLVPREQRGYAAPAAPRDDLCGSR